MKRTHEQAESEPRDVIQIGRERNVAYAAWRELAQEYKNHPDLARKKLYEAVIPFSVHSQILEKSWPGKGTLKAIECGLWPWKIDVTFSESGLETFIGERDSYTLSGANTADFVISAPELWARALAANPQNPAAALAACIYAWKKYGDGDHYWSVERWARMYHPDSDSDSDSD